MNKGSDMKIKRQGRVTVINNGVVTVNRVMKADLFVNVVDWIELERWGSSHTENCGKDQQCPERGNMLPVFKAMM